MSVTYSRPSLPIAMPAGLLNCAASPAPSAKPATPLPAKDVTTPLAVTFRIRSLLVSATYTVPSAATVTAHGLLNCAAVPVPLAKPAVPLPASVVTSPAGLIFRIRFPNVSATCRKPLTVSYTIARNAQPKVLDCYT